MENLAKGVPEHSEKRPFDRTDCIEATKNELDSEAFDYFGEGISLADKFLLDDTLPVSQSGFVRLYSLDQEFDQILSDFSLEAQDQDTVIDDFGKKVFDEATRNALDEQIELDQLELLLDNHQSQRIKSDISNSTGMLVKRGWQVFQNQYGNAILLIHNPKKQENPYTPALKVVNLDLLHDANPDFVEDETRNLYRANLEQKIANNVSYNLAIHEIDESQIVPNYISELAVADEQERQNIADLLILIEQNDDEGAQRITNLHYGLRRMFVKADDGRTVPLDTYLEHISTCPSETDHIQTKSQNELGVLNKILASTSNLPGSRPVTRMILEGQEILKHPLHHTNEFIDYSIKIEGESFEEDKDFLNLINRTSTRGKGIDSPAKELKRRLPASNQLLERFKAALGESVLRTGSNFEEFFDDAVQKLSMDLGTTLLNYGIKDLGDVENAIAQSLYTKAFRLSGKEDWTWKESRSDPYRPKVELRDENLRDIILYLALKTVQQKGVSSSVRSGADQAIGWLKEKYTDKVRGSQQTIDELELRKKNSRKIMHKLGISKHQIARMVDHVKKENLGKYQQYDYQKFGILFRTLVYSKQGIIDLDSKPTKATLSALYPNIKAEDWALLKY